jgi:hypothetical protein
MYKKSLNYNKQKCSTDKCVLKVIKRGSRNNKSSCSSSPSLQYTSPYKSSSHCSKSCSSKSSKSCGSKSSKSCGSKSSKSCGAKSSESCGSKSSESYDHHTRGHKKPNKYDLNCCDKPKLTLIKHGKKYHNKQKIIIRKHSRTSSSPHKKYKYTKRSPNACQKKYKCSRKSSSSSHHKEYKYTNGSPNACQTKYKCSNKSSSSDKVHCSSSEHKCSVFKECSASE